MDWNPFRKKTREPELGEVIESGSVEFEYAEPEPVKETFEEAAGRRDEAQHDYEEAMKEARAEAEREAADQKEQVEESRDKYESTTDSEWEQAQKSATASTKPQKSVKLLKAEEKAAIAKAKAERYSANKQVWDTRFHKGKKLAEDVYGVMGGSRESRYARKGRRSAKEIARTVRKVATFGGPIGMRKQVAGLYLSTGMQKLNAPPTGMRSLTSPGKGSGSDLSALRNATNPFNRTLRTATTPQGSALRGVTTLSGQRLREMTMIKPVQNRAIVSTQGTVRTSGLAQAEARFRALGYPKGLTQTEQVAYQEIKSNNDIDTKAHVVSELMSMGISRGEAIQAVDGLVRKGVVSKGREFDGAPTLEVKA